MKGLFEKALREVRDEWGTREVKALDWDAIDKSLFERLDRERDQHAARFAKGPSRRVGVAVAGVFAVAAALALAIGEGREAPSDGGTSASSDESGGVIASVEGRVFVNHAPAARGAVVRLGDVIEAAGRVTIDRPGRLTLVLERDSSVAITHVRGALVLALQRGAVEASVMPVPTGEAFAVDVESSRVAVHGTHLRVARAGSQAVLDLSEGVVSIGQAPRVGTVLGTVIVAPAHAEFAASDPQGTLTVTHDASAVRLPIPIAAAAPVAAAPLLAPSQTKAEPNPSHGAFGPAPVRPENRAAPSATQPAASEAETTLANAVRACMAERPAPENVTVEVQTTLYLVLQDDGSVRSARFEPPVAPDVNECATPAIYRARFTHGGSTSLVLSYVSPQSAARFY